MFFLRKINLKCQTVPTRKRWYLLFHKKNLRRFDYLDPEPATQINVIMLIRIRNLGPDRLLRSNLKKIGTIPLFGMMPLFCSSTINRSEADELLHANSGRLPLQQCCGSVTRIRTALMTNGSGSGSRSRYFCHGTSRRQKNPFFLCFFATLWRYIHIIFQRTSHKTVGIKGFLTIFAWW